MDTEAIARRDQMILSWLVDRPEQFGPRVLHRLVTQPYGCWEWPLSVNTGGYGQIGLRGDMVLVHRVVYLFAHGSIAEGMHIDHICRNRRCANPDHLRELTPGDNFRASSGYMKERCPAGHALTDGNLSAAHLKRGARVCLQCQLQREKQRDEMVLAARTKLGLSAREYARQYGRGERAARAVLDG